MKDWVDYGEEFRTSVSKGTALGKTEWNKWMTKETAHDKMAEGDEKRREKGRISGRRESRGKAEQDRRE